MHSQNHRELSRVLAADRVRAAQRGSYRGHRHRPPPLRARAAHVTARLAGRLDRESARRAVA